MLTKNVEDFIKSKLLEYRAELESVLSGGDISQYNYYSDDENNDINFGNRLRISLAIWYMSEGLDVESLTVVLMNEEIKSLENSPFGGTSETSFLLTRKLLKYNKVSYKSLFKRARHANFDCYFGYDIKHIKKFLNSFKDWREEDWEYMFELMNDTKSLKTFKKLNEN